MTQVIICGASGFTNVAALLQLLEQQGLDARVATEADIAMPAPTALSLRAYEDFPAPVLYAGEHKLKGSGRSELGRLRKQALHNKARKPF